MRDGQSSPPTREKPLAMSLRPSITMLSVSMVSLCCLSLLGRIETMGRPFSGTDEKSGEMALGSFLGPDQRRGVGSSNGVQ